jgi:enterochelin esterase-like enzyme
VIVMRTGIRALSIILLAWLIAGCAAREAQLLETAPLTETRLGRPMELAVLRAPVTAGVDPAELPVFVLLHGMGGNHLDLDRYGLSRRLRQAMIAGRIPPVHFALPDGERGFFVNWYDGTHPYEDYLLEDAIPAAEQLLGVTPSRERRHLIGVSMGGQGALRIGLTHPDRFASTSCLSSLVLDRDEARQMLASALIRWTTDAERAFGDGTDAAFSDSQNAFRLAARRSPTPAQKIFLAAGKRERRYFRETTGRFAAHLERLGLEHRYVVYDGGHGWEDWLPVIEQAIDYVTR